MTKRQDNARHRAASNTGSLEVLSKAVASNAGTMGRQAAVIAAAGGLVVTLGVTGTANSVQAADQAPAESNTATLDVQRVAANNVVASKVSVKEFKKSLPVVKVKAAPAPEPVAEVSTLTETAESAAATAQTRADEQAATSQAASEPAAAEQASSSQGEAYTATDRANEGSSSQGVTKTKKKKTVAAAPESSSQGGEAYTAADNANGGSSTAVKPAKKASSSESSAPKASGKASSSGVAGTALSYVGTPYVWGGKGPGGWDCSGFVSYVYRQHGMSIPSQTSAIRFSGKVKKVSDPQPGDLLFQRGGGHVAIYIGGGKYVGAQNPSVGTVVRSLNSTYDSFTGFYRYVG